MDRNINYTYKNIVEKFLKVILIILGILFLFIGIDKGLGGILTLGIQVNSEFLDIIDQYIFDVQDSHVRFFGGVFFGMGIYMLIAARDLLRNQQGLNLIFFVVFLGGVFRFSQLNFEVLFGKDILLSIFAEVILMPILYYSLKSYCSRFTNQ